MTSAVARSAFSRNGVRPYRIPSAHASRANAHEADERGVVAAALHQLGVRAFLSDAAVLEDDDAVRADHCREPVRDGEGRPTADQPREGILHQRLGLGVERAGRLVEDEHGRVEQQRSGDGDALPLPRREQGSALADLRLVALGQLRDELMRVRRWRSDFCFTCRRSCPSMRTAPRTGS